MVSASTALMLAGGGAGIATAFASGSAFHALAIVGIAAMGAVAMHGLAAARDAADEERWWSLQCRRFELSNRGGFLPASPPGEVELDERFSAWERLGGRLAALNARGSLEGYVANHVPLVDAAQLLDVDTRERRDASVRRAYVLLGAAVQSYAYRRSARWAARDGNVARKEEGPPADVLIPAALAVPWRWVCRELDLPPGAVCACGVDLWNWVGPPAPAQPRYLTEAGKTRAADAAKAAEAGMSWRQILTPRFLWSAVGFSDPRARTAGLDEEGVAKEAAEASFAASKTGFASGGGAPDPRGISVSMTGTKTEASFHLLATKMHARSARDLPALLRLPNDVAARDAYAIQRTLRALKTMLDDFLVIFRTVHADVDPVEFYEGYRPLLSGSWDAPLRLQNADGGVEEVRAKGPSAGQSTIFLVLDLALGVRPPALDGGGSAHAAFQADMLNYMPPPHRALVRDYADRVTAAGPIAGACKRRVLRRDLDAALASLQALRKFHIDVAASYLRKTGTGTGASDFRSMLADGIARTAAAKGTKGPAAKAKAA